MNTVTPSSPRLQVKGKMHSELGRARHAVEKPRHHQVFFSLVQRPNQVILGTTSMSREEPNKSPLVLCCSELWLVFTYRHSVVSCFYDTGVPSPWQVLLGTIIKQIKTFQLSKHP